MIIEVKVPQLSESVSEATLLEWHKKEGQSVARDENLVDIETDKVVMELPAPVAGVLSSIVKSDRSTVVAGEVIATIDTEAKGTAAQPEPAVPTAQPAAPPREVPPAMPAARKLAQHFAMPAAHIQDAKAVGSDVGYNVEDAGDYFPGRHVNSAASARPIGSSFAPM